MRAWYMLLLLGKTAALWDLRYPLFLLRNIDARPAAGASFHARRTQSDKLLLGRPVAVPSIWGSDLAQVNSLHIFDRTDRGTGCERRITHLHAAG